ncbi:MAG: hypothetical protein O3A01_04770 [bacterium]|nr:hypothetical protein [bacterium]
MNYQKLLCGALFVICYVSSGISTHANTPNITINSAYTSHDFFEPGTTLSVARYTETMPIKKSKDFEEENDQKSLYLGLFDSEKNLILPIMEQQYFESGDHYITIQNIEKKDLNRDSKMDLIIDVTERSEFIQSTNSYFFINTGDEFVEVKQSFPKESYKFLNDNTIRVESPLDAFGKPFEEAEAQANSAIWRDYYQFMDIELKQINRRYGNYYKEVLGKAEQELERLFVRIKRFQMEKDNPNGNQLQLNEYYYQITNQKLLIQRCREIL